MGRNVSPPPMVSPLAPWVKYTIAGFFALYVLGQISSRLTYVDPTVAKFRGFAEKAKRASRHTDFLMCNVGNVQACQTLLSESEENCSFFDSMTGSVACEDKKYFQKKIVEAKEKAEIESEKQQESLPVESDPDSSPTPEYAINPTPEYAINPTPSQIGIADKTAQKQVQEPIEQWTGKLIAKDSKARINVRIAPDISSRSLHYGVVNDRVLILAEQVDRERQTWYRVRFPQSEAEGWVRGDFIQVDFPPTY